MKKIVFITLYLFGLTVAAHAQMVEFTVNGLVPDQTYTLAQMKAAFGNNPSREGTQQSELGTNYFLEYGDDYFAFSTHFGWTNFILRTNIYHVVIDNVTFRVGDNISILSTIPNSQLILEEGGVYYLQLYMDDPIRIRFNSSNIITSISFSASV
jgi:hypothetical protein